MTVLSADKIHDGWQGQQDPGGSSDFTVLYLVKVDDREDGPLTILDSSLIPDINDSYSVGNDVDSGLICKRRIPRPRGGLLWEVTLVFGPPKAPEEDEPTDGLDEDGEPTDNPLLERPTIRVNSVHRTRPALRGTYLGNNGVVNKVMTIGQFYTPKNSAGEPFDPPFEDDDPYLAISYSRNIEVLPLTDWLPFYKAANAGDFVINRPNFQFTCEEATAKMNSFGADERIRNGIIYFRFSWTVWWRPEGWDEEFPDLSYNRRAINLQDAADDGSTLPSTANFPAQKRQILDDQNRPLQAPSRLNGDGAPLAQDADDVYMKYRIKELVDFNPLVF